MTVKMGVFSSIILLQLRPHTISWDTPSKNTGLRHLPKVPSAFKTVFNRVQVDRNSEDAFVFTLHLAGMLKKHYLAGWT